MSLVDVGRRGLLFSAAATAFWSAAGRGLAKVIGYARVMEGPMVGPPGPGHITIWARFSGAFDVTLEVSEDRAFTAPVASEPVPVGPATDYTAALRVAGLKPATEYFYRLRMDGILDRHGPVPFRTRTAPAGPAPFRVAYGSCTRIQLDPDQPVFSAVVAQEPDLFFWLGDNVYGDSDSAEAHADLYRRQRLVQRALPLYRRTPSLAIWDDHDFGFNNADGSNPVKADILRTFRNYWPNPSYGEAKVPGVYFRYAYGGIDFFFLDGRYHRDAPEAPNHPGKTMLGAAQKAWLKRELKASRAPFKILVSGTGWSMAERNGDSWADFPDERNELFDFIRDEKVEGVVCLSGDQHVGEVNCVPWSRNGGYDIYDLVSSPLAQMMADKWPDQSPEIRMRPVYSKSVNFGLLSFTFDPEPTLTFTLHDVMGAAVWPALELKAADLRNGVSTWEAKIDPREAKRRGRVAAGKTYFGED